MTKAVFSALLLLNFFIGSAQQGFLVVKKKSKTIQRFSNGSIITFQLNTGEWVSGNIILLRPDSLLIRPRSIRYNMFGADTVYFSQQKIAYRDITLLPRNTAMVFYRNDKPQVIHGHEKFAWVKNGLIFKLIGGGYAALNVTNNLINGDPVFGKTNRKRLGVAAAIFFIGEILHLNYHQHLNLGKKYRLQYIDIDKTKNSQQGKKYF